LSSPNGYSFPFPDFAGVIGPNVRGLRRGCPRTRPPGSRRRTERATGATGDERPHAEKSILADGFTAGLEEPDSAKFRWTKVPKSLPPTAFEYCGLINVKNGTSYTGIKPFLATIRTENGNIIGGAIAALNSENRDENRDVIPKLCRQKGLNPFDAR
jgi:hypothetical protein